EAILASGHPISLRAAILLGKRELALVMISDDPAAIRWPIRRPELSGLSGGKTPLALAASGRDRELVRALLDAGADVNEGTHMPNAGGEATALTNAVWAGDPEIVRLLLARGARVDVIGGKRYATILEYARAHSTPVIVDLMLQADLLRAGATAVAPAEA